MLEFDRLAHTYTNDGVIVPSVTDFVGILGDDVDEYIEDAMERAADCGVTCHAVIEMALQGEDYTGEYPTAYQAHVNAIEQFLSENTIEPIAIEQPIYSSVINVAGTPDLLCMFNGKLAVLDWKCVSSIAKTKVKAQLNGYNAAYNEIGVFPEKLYAIQFLPNGTYRLYPTAVGDMEFETCFNLYKLKNSKHPRGLLKKKCPDDSPAK